MNSKDSVPETWEKFLNPSKLKTNLIKISIYMCGFEVLSDSIVSRIRDFYSLGNKGPSEEYKSRFEKRIFEESLNWLVEHNVIGQEDKVIAIELKNYRNELAHEMAKYIAAEKTIREEYFIAVYAMLTKIDQWWAYNVDIDFEDENINQDLKMEDIQSGSMFMLQLLNHVYTGKDAELECFYQDFLKQSKEMGVSRSQKKKESEN